MTDVYTQESASKKKFLAPLLVILLCMVSLTAAGYAYSATVDNQDNPIDVEGLTLQLTDAEGNIVNDAMYDLKFALGSHNINGKAVYSTDARGFTDADTFANYTGTLDGFATGYYVDVEYKIGAGGSFAPVTGEEQVLGSAYKLIVDNEASTAATLTVSMSKVGDVPSFVKQIYLVITETGVAGEDTADNAKVYLVGAPDVDDTDATILLDEGKDEYSVQAYFVVDDFFVSVDDIDDLLSVAGCTFGISFSATA